MHDYDIQTTLNDIKTLHEERLKALENKQSKLEAHAFRPQVETTLEEPDHHTAAFMNYLRKGLERPLQEYEAKTLATTPDKDGGYLIPTGLQNRLYSTLQETSVMRGLANICEISTSALEMLIDKDAGDAGWVAETAERAETKTPELVKLHIPVHEMYARPRATQRLLDDASLNVEEWLSQKIAQKMATLENTAFLTGDGNNKPKGILACESVPLTGWAWGKLEEIKTGVDGGFREGRAAEVLLSLFHSLKPAYLPGASWLMSRQTQGILRNLRDSGIHEYLWQPPLSAMPTPTLLGYPVVICDDMPNLAPNTASKSILFGNFKEGYQIVDRSGLRVLRDPYSSKPHVEFYATRRVGGNILNYEALKVLNFAS